MAQPGRLDRTILYSARRAQFLDVEEAILRVLRPYVDDEEDDRVARMAHDAAQAALRTVANELVAEAATG